jgi:hypothetical protein
MVLDLIGDTLYRELGGYPQQRDWLARGERRVAEFWGKNRARELARFERSPECCVMLLGKEGAHGLDLSFVTHVFFLEGVQDESLKDQVHTWFTRA